MIKEGVAVIPVMGVGNLAKWVRLFSAYEIPVFVIFDSDSEEDADGYRRDDLFTALELEEDVAQRLLTILFLDIVGSTERAVKLGDAPWRELLAAHYARTERELAAHEGREVDRAGDGLVAVFEGPTRAIRCAQAIQRTSGIELRAGIHTGEVELDGSGIKGIAVHTAARVCGAASPGELLISSTVCPGLPEPGWKSRIAVCTSSRACRNRDGCSR